MYKRILLKLSGEILMGEYNFGIDVKILKRITSELIEVSNLGIEIIIEIGGGNIYRWKKAQPGIKRNIADNMGILGSVMNAINLSNIINEKSKAHALSPVYMPSIIEYYNPEKADNYLKKGNIIIIGGGVGSQFFTTDTGAVLHALQTGCEVVLKGSNVDGVYSADPKLDPKAKKYDQLTYQESISKKLTIMDMTAFSLAEENNLSIVVFNAEKEGGIIKAAKGEKIGTNIY